MIACIQINEWMKVNGKCLTPWFWPISLIKSYSSDNTVPLLLQLPGCSCSFTVDVGEVVFPPETFSVESSTTTTGCSCGHLFQAGVKESNTAAFLQGPAASLLRRLSRPRCGGWAGGWAGGWDWPQEWLTREVLVLGDTVYTACNTGRMWENGGNQGQWRFCFET